MHPHESTDAGITWRVIPRNDLFTPFGTSIVSVVSLPQGQVIAGLRGTLGYFPFPTSTGLDLSSAPYVPSQIDHLLVDPRDELIVLTDVSGKQHRIVIAPGLSNSIDLTQLGLSPGVYGVTIGHGRDLRRQTVLITR
jgi:hypothetical protein